MQRFLRAGSGRRSSIASRECCEGPAWVPGRFREESLRFPQAAFFLSFPKLAKRFGNVACRRNLVSRGSPVPVACARVGKTVWYGVARETEFRQPRRAQSASLTLGTRGGRITF